MKKSIRILSVVLVALMLCLSLTACGKTLSGKYTSDAGIFGETTYEFSGKKVEISYKSLLGTVTTVEGEYEIDDDKITITITDEDADDDDAKKLSGTFAFEEQDDGDIKIGVIEYKKA
ncbi:MAG: hypothetical protein IJX94_00415 [Clostridia bacterium]|nr:hypothetical protein [Clostridia bacterium]